MQFDAEKFDPATKAAIIKKLFEFGQQIAIRRKAMKLTQREVADLVGVRDQGHVSRLETAQRKGLSYATMVNTARKLGLDIKITFSIISQEERLFSEAKKPQKAVRKPGKEEKPPPVEQPVEQPVEPVQKMMSMTARLFIPPDEFIPENTK